MCYLPSKSGILSAALVTVWPTPTISPPGILRIFFVNTYDIQYMKQIYTQYQNLHSPYNLNLTANGKWTNQLVSLTPLITKQMQYFSISELLCKNTPVFTEISQELFHLLEYLLYYIFTLNL